MRDEHYSVFHDKRLMPGNFKKYFVYIDDGQMTFRIAVAAPDEDTARALCAGNGDIVAVRDVTDDFQIDVRRLSKALMDAGFNGSEHDFIVRHCTQFGVCE